MSHRNNPEWRDPTANEAIGNAFIQDQNRRRPTSITPYREDEPLSKFEDKATWRGRRRLLKALHAELAKAGKNSSANTRRVKDEIRALSRQQFVSRVTPEEARQFTGRRSY